MHDLLLERWGEMAGDGHREAEYEGADAAVQAVKNSYYQELEELAAAYAVYIVQGHVFLDGNKRTGAAAMSVFLQANGGRVHLDSDGVADAMIELQRRAEDGADVAGLVEWLAGLHRVPNGRPGAGARRRPAL